MECQKQCNHKYRKRSSRSQQIQTHKPKLRNFNCVNMKVKRASGLHNGWTDFVDTPDPYVVMHCQQTVEKCYKTEVKYNTRTPEFNETTTFTIIDKDPVMDIKLMEKNEMFPDGIYGQFTGNLESIPRVIEFNKNVDLSLSICSKMKKSDIRVGQELCEEENDFQRKRRPIICKGLAKLLGIPLPTSESDRVPTIAVLGSGGGFRAMMGMSGVYKALVDTGLLDCVTYTVGLSGSCWYLSTLCSHPDWPDVHPSVVDDNLRRCVGKSLWETMTSLKTFCKSVNENKNTNRPWTFTDLFGHWVGETLIPDRINAKWSDQKDKVCDGRCPLPLLSCVNAKVDTPVKQFHEWMEISPFEVHMPKYATSLKTEHFHSKFYKGLMTDKIEEPPLHYLMGICGSAYTALHKSFSEMAAKSERLSRSSRGSDGDANTSDETDGTLSSVIECVKSILDRCDMNYFDNRTGRSAKVYNFMHQLTLEEVDEEEEGDVNEKGEKDKQEEIMETISVLHDNVFTNVHEPMTTDNEYMCLIDAGLAFNSPYPIVLRPKRQVDLILSFEFSDRGKDDNQPFEQLLLAKQWADVHKVPFPPINTEHYKGKSVQEVYVFQDEDDLSCPIILHFVLVNNDFRHKFETDGKQTEEDREFADFVIFDDGEYDSINFEFNEKQFLRISKLMEFNVHNNMDIVKDTILKLLERHESSSCLP